MEERVLYTTSDEDIIESISNIIGCSIDNINTYLKQSIPYKNKSVIDININHFFNCIGLRFTNNNDLFNKIKFDSCIISHLTSRRNTPDNSDIHCLTKALSEDTEISRFLASQGITFKKTSKGLILYYNNELVDWNLYDCSAAYRARKRLRFKGRYIDNCINGFLFNHLFWEDSNVEHIKDCPEIVADICYILNRFDIIREWNDISDTYAVGFIVNIKDIIFDEHTNYTTSRSKIYLTYKYVIYYLVQCYHKKWESRFDNPIIRLRDNDSISKDRIIGFYKIER